MKFINTNAIHNLLNFAIIALTGMVGFDWTMLGIDAERALLITGVLTLIKIMMNVTRDGITGLAKVQPPVEDAKPDDPDYSAGV